MILQKHGRVSLVSWLVLGFAALSFTSKAHANVYATDIQINSTLTGVAAAGVGSPVSITYHLNDNATAGVTVKILSGNSVVASFAGTTNMGLNTVSWTPSVAGTYSVSITAGSTGYPTWQQISPLTTNYTAVFPLGMAVDKNANSPYYGRVILGCAASASANGVTQQCGFYKFNADGTPADEGAFGFANYTTNDGGVTSIGQMPFGPAPGYGQWRNPSTIRIGEDDRIYWQDNSDGGAIVACDMLTTTNQVIICNAQAVPPGDIPGALVGPGYGNSPADRYVNQATYGWMQFDVINVGTSNSYTGSNGVYTGKAALFLNDWDYPCAGVWMWHLVGAPGSMTSDPTDTYGEQAVVANGSTISLRSDGIAVDYNLDLLVGQNRFNAADPAIRSACWTNWNGGVLPPGNQGGAQGGAFIPGAYAEDTGGVLWTEGGGSSSSTDRGVFDVVLNSKSNPTLLARAHAATATDNGIDLIIPFNPTITITSVSLSGGNLTINCLSSSPYAPVATDLSLYAAADVTQPFSAVGATFTGSNGVFQATTSVTGPVGYFRVAYPPVAGTSAQGQVVTTKISGPEADTTAGIDTGVYYSAVAFDNVGNLYGGNASDNYWRVWSPPGPNTNTTAAVATIIATAGN